MTAGFSGARDAIALADVERGYCAGEIAVFEEVRPYADARFGCRGITQRSKRHAFANAARAELSGALGRNDRARKRKLLVRQAAATEQP